MKKLFLLFFALVMSLGTAWADKKVYLDPTGFSDNGDWASGSAKFAVWAWPDGGDGTWYLMSSVANTAYYEVSIPDERKNIIIARLNSNINEDDNSGWWSNVWNRAINITLTENTLIKITGWEGGATYYEDNQNKPTSPYTKYSATESVNTYTVNFITNTWAAPKVYAFGNNSFELFGEWSGTTMTDAGTETINGTSYKKWSVSSEHPVVPTGLIFNDGNGEVIGTNKTIDLPFVNNRTYYLGVTGAAVSNDTNVAEDAIAFIGTNNVSNILNNIGAQPNSYDNDGNMNIVVDLGPTRTIDAFSITLSGDRWVSEFDLSYSTDGASYTNIGTYTTGISSNTTTTISEILATPVTAKYIKYTSKKSNKNVDDIYSESIKNFQLIQYAPDALVISSLTANPTVVSRGAATDIMFTAKNSQNKDLSSYGSRVTVAYEITDGEGTLEGNTLTATSASVTITATATDVINSTTSTATTTITSIIAPAAKAEVQYPNSDILKVYTADYTTGQNGSGWGKGTHKASWTSASTYSVGASTVLHVMGNGYSCRTEGTTNATGYTTAYVAVFPITGGTLYVYDDNSNSVNPFMNVTARQWNIVKLPINFNTNYIGFSIVGETELFVDYIVLSTEETVAPFVIGVEEANGFVPVAGTITTGNVSAVESITAKVIDLRGATIDDGVTGITLHTNQLILAKAEAASPGGDKTSVMATTLSDNTSNVIITDNTYYWAMKPIVYTDQNEYQPVSFSINTLSQGYTITRSIPAGKYVTAAPMAAVTAPEGINVYEFTDYTAGSVTFSKKANNNLAIKTPYVLHNTTDSPIDLVVSGTGDLNPTVDAVTVTQNSANFIANLSEITTTGTQYVLSSGTIYKGNGMKVGAYRAYFTDVAAAVGAKAIFIDGDETTKIGTIDANGEIEVGEVYNLAGQRVQNPTKGIYIINGKKVLK